MTHGNPFSTSMCNACGGTRNHEILHSHVVNWVDEDPSVYGHDEYQTLKCMGCDRVRFKKVCYSSDDPDNPEISDYPPLIFRKVPEWFPSFQLCFFLTDEEGIPDLVMEVYTCIENNLNRSAAMGIRAVIEQIMISKVSDNGSFENNLQKFMNAGFISTIQMNNIKNILEVGHATIHRLHDPSREDVITLVDITESVIQTVYLHSQRIDAARSRVPPRKRSTGG